MSPNVALRADQRPRKGLVRGAGGGGGKGGGGGGATATEDPNTLTSNSTARILDLISEGEIGGLVNGAQSIFLDATPLQDSTGRSNFAGVVYDERTGLSDQDYMSGFSDAETPVVINLEVKADTPITRTFNGPVDAARISISLPQLTYQDPNSGDLHGSSVTFTISKRVHGTSTWTDLDPITITGKTVGNYEASYRVELGGSTDWDIKITRNTADSTEVNLQNKTFWSAVDLITDGKFQYPDSAYIGITIDAQQFGSSIPTRSYDVYGIKVKVPSNYNPVTRAYTGIWDGTFQIAWTDNPAWVFYDIASTKRYGLGNYLAEAEIDKWALYSIAQYCDELVPDGFGGLEPRYTFNYQIMGADDAYKVLQSIVSCWRGLTYSGSGLITVIADMPADPAVIVTPANVIDGLITYEGTALSARHSVAQVTWFDPADNCNPAIEMVEDPDLINGVNGQQGLGWRVLEMTAYGCTSRGQAHRMGRWALDTERYASETVNYQAAWDHLGVMPGEIAEVYDPAYQKAKMAGRILASTSNSVTLDAAVTIEAGKTYTLRLKLSDGTTASRVLTNGHGSASVLTFAAALSPGPVENAVYGITVSDLSPRLFRILSIKDNGDGTFTVSGLFHDPTKYDRIEQNIKLDPVAYTRFVNSRPTAPRNLSVREYLYKYGVDLRTAAALAWQAPADGSVVGSYEVQRRRPDGNWETLARTRALTFDVLNCESGAWSFRVGSIGFNGLLSEWLQMDANLFGLALPPGDVQNFNLHVVGALATLSWDANTDLDIAYYHVKFAAVTVGATWSSSVDLQPNISGTSVQVPTMVGTYLIKAVDSSGNESVNATAVVTTVGAVTGLNEIAAVSDYPSWPGTKTDVEFIDGALQLVGQDVLADWTTLSSIPVLSYGTEGIAPIGYYTFANYYDLGAVYTSRLSAIIDASGTNILDFMSTWSTLSSIQNMSGADSTEWDLRVQVQTTNDDPAGSPTWSDWHDLVVGDYTARAIWPRLVLFSNDLRVTPIISDVTINIDMPDRTDGVNNVSVSVSGATVTFSPAFRATPAVGITGQNLQTGDYWSYTAGPSANGFAGVWKNSSGAAVARSMDWIAKGIGYAS